MSGWFVTTEYFSVVLRLALFAIVLVRVLCGSKYKLVIGLVVLYLISCVAELATSYLIDDVVKSWNADNMTDNG